MPQIRHEVTFAAAPAKVYQALMSSAQHASFTGAPAEVSTDEGGAFSCFGGQIHGRNVALVPSTRIVQAWRARTWPEGVFSIARFELREEGGKTRLVFEQDGVPDDAREHLDGGWHKMYWEPLRKYLES
ncbi:MAG: SRPBCC domain-containing protein [Myxococcaceae bacterium]|nr:SRPBCC domain-containing protein [Myxococcaceae bacterium]MCI0672421.1 SRPBCC domain-containing protein [Myxococcaceae bacterium]